VTQQAVIVSIEVAADPLLAFEVFTTQIDAWWLRGPKHRFKAPWNGTLAFEADLNGQLLGAGARYATTIPHDTANRGATTNT
jgi:hypothetical protein